MLIIATLFPVALTALYLISLETAAVKKELLDSQKTLVYTVENSLRTFLTRRNSTLRAYARILSMPFISARTENVEAELRGFAAEYPDFKSLVIMDADGNIKASHGSPLLIPSSSGLVYELRYIKEAIAQDRRSYIGTIRDAGEEKDILLAVPVRDASGKPKNILAAEVGLGEVFGELDNLLPAGSDLFFAVFAPGSPMAHSTRPMSKAMFENYKKTAPGTSGEYYENGKNYLSYKGVMPSLGWTVYVSQEASPVKRLLLKDKTALSKIAVLFVIAMAFIYMAGRFFIQPVTDPLKQLKSAAEKVEKENFEDLPEIEDFPENEVGDLASSFLVMADTIKKRKIALARAVSALEDSNKTLEKKVDERTRALKAATETLVQKERLSAIGEMASIISHEIRNPLAVISNSSRLLKALAPHDNPKLDKQFTIIEAEITQANKIIEEVLGFARARAPLFSNVEIKSYIKDLLSVYPRPENVRLKEIYPKESAYIKIDAEEMKQALRNIIGNAVEIMPGGGQITVTVRAGKRAVSVCVKDEGAGMDEATRSRIFAPFFTTKARGTGLGLAVVKKAVVNSGGKIFVKSELGKGTEFCLYFKRTK